ncbi:MAG: 50S ribosomal protein L6 [Clostridiales bacterium]|nr:50S ribosomal protein L6 [Clostridiales bacterium]
MSRIGRIPVTIPAGVTVTIDDKKNTITVKGPLGTLTEQIHPRIRARVEGDKIHVERSSDEKEERGLHGLTRALINNMVIGVSKGFEKTLEIIGVGYKAVLQGQTLMLYVGYSLDENGRPQEKYCIKAPEGIKFEVPEKMQVPTIIVKGCDKHLVGQVAANIRSMRPPEPYHGKGIRYKDEVVRLKVAKTGK